MEIKFKVDIKTIKKALALMGLDIPSDEELENKFKDAVVDLTQSEEPEVKEAEIGFVLMAIFTVYNN